mgnify:CR=1 FL=1
MAESCLDDLIDQNCDVLISEAEKIRNHANAIIQSLDRMLGANTLNCIYCKARILHANEDEQEGSPS